MRLSNKIFVERGQNHWQSDCLDFAQPFELHLDMQALQYISVPFQDLRSSEIEFRKLCRSRDGACSRRSTGGNTARSWRRGTDGG
ncbi:hypothetical protein ACFX2A_002339 [Malus domestica]